MTGKVYLIGAGPGDPDLLTVKAARLLGQVDAVVYDRLVSPGILALVPPGTQVFPVGKTAGHHSVPQPRINQMLVDLAREGRTVARLKGGDPLIFGRGGEEAETLAAHGIAVEIVPGITAAQGAAASTGVPLTHRGLAAGVRYVTGHRAEDVEHGPDWPGLADPDTTLVVYMGAAQIGAIAKGLIGAGRAADTPVLAISSATTPQEKRLTARLDGIGQAMADAPMPSPVLFIIGAVAGLYPPEPPV
ncbi:uroporphyrinogen-III C-methyltransferase [Paracoccus pacificus]|uniref:uroporphyrinogen-III C-methyltransferase n=1 Tax=Paracoccus pacificus TaxID=1463598 RepID=A0ABW4R8L6_9RHOB